MDEQHQRTPYDVIIVGGGQAGLAVGYHLRRTGRSFVILDDQAEPGGAWLRTWDALRLFSPARYSSLPGWPLPRSTDAAFPHRDDVIEYLHRYEERYDLPVERPVRVEAVRCRDGRYVLETSIGTWRARAVVSATGTWANPRVPTYPGQDAFRGEQLHSARYRSPMWLTGGRVVVIGGGNSGAQIMAEVSQVAEATWATREAPTFLPEDVDGRVLFMEATARYEAQKEGSDPKPAAYGLGDIVQVEPVRRARREGRLERRPMFERFTREGVVWTDGTEEPVDTVIWATGFDAALDPLRPLGVVGPGGHVKVEGTRSVQEPRLWLVGYGPWTGFASATLIGVGRTARQTVREIDEALSPVPVG